MDKIKLDKRDRDILSIFCNDARLNYNQIAKITHISKDSVRNRILRLEKERYLFSYFPLLNYQKFGVSLIHVYCKLKSIKDISPARMKSLIDNPDISAITWIMGKYDLELQIPAKNKKQVKKILENSGFLDRIKEYAMVFVGRPLIYSTTHLNTKEIVYSSKDSLKQEILDKHDKELIQLLCVNARERNIDLADKLKLKEDEVRYRIKKLVDKQVILGFYARTDRTFMGLTKYLTLMKTNKELSRKEISSLAKMSNIFYLKECKGCWDYTLRFQAGVDTELVKTFYHIRDLLSKNLIDLKVHTILEVIKFSPYTELILK